MKISCYQHKNGQFYIRRVSCEPHGNHKAKTQSRVTKHNKKASEGIQWKTTNLRRQAQTEKETMERENQKANDKMAVVSLYISKVL